MDEIAPMGDTPKPRASDGTSAALGEEGCADWLKKSCVKTT
jgi:hypothetical protein